MKTISLLGSTGSIGTQCLDVCRHHPEEYKVMAMTCHQNIETFSGLVGEFRPKVAVCAKEEDALLLAKEFPETEFFYGQEGIMVAATMAVDLVVNALSGVAGLAPTYGAIKAGRDIALANKETLVAGGSLVMPAAKEHGISLFPVDSEHCAIFQCFQGVTADQVEKLILTGSGGPFRQYSYDAMERATVVQALQHPNWAMGAKITIDSATMMNKGLEFIEAMWLFDQPADKIQIVIHPQSIVHSMVQLVDGNVMAQMGPVDMRLPIALAMSWPKRLENQYKQLDFTKAMNLTFEKPDLEKFRCLKLALQVAHQGGSYPIVMNAANEELVHLILEEKIMFGQLSRYLEECLAEHKGEKFLTVEDVLAIDKEARMKARELCGVTQ